MESRWARLFEDLEAQFAAPAADEAEVADLVEAERVGLRLAERLARRVGHELRVALRDGTGLRGRLRECAATWMALEDDTAVTFVPLKSVAFAGPLAGSAPQARSAAGGSLAAALRGVARAGVHVVAGVAGHEIAGVLVLVGADHADLRTEQGEVFSLPLEALDWLRCPVAVFAG